MVMLCRLSLVDRGESERREARVSKSRKMKNENVPFVIVRAVIILCNASVNGKISFYPHNTNSNVASLLPG
eukprot:scaffold1596_cov80-Skeletonema_menzelii.AAC.1